MVMRIKRIRKVMDEYKKCVCGEKIIIGNYCGNCGLQINSDNTTIEKEEKELQSLYCSNCENQAFERDKYCIYCGLKF